MQEAVTGWGRDLLAAADEGDEAGALAALNRHRVLCAHREGRWGVQGWTEQITDWIAGRTRAPAVDIGDGDDPAGPPILVTVNDKETDTSNGDCGVVIRDVRTTADPGGPVPLTVAFTRGESGVHRVHPAAVGCGARLRDDHSPQPGQPVRGRDGSTATGRFGTADPRVVVHGHHPRPEEVWIVGTLDVLKAAVDRRVARAAAFVRESGRSAPEFGTRGGHRSCPDSAKPGS